MTKFIAKGRVSYNGKLFTSGQVFDVEDKDVEEFKRYGWEIAGNDGISIDAKIERPPLEELTRTQIKNELDERGIQYKPNFTKQQLINLLEKK